MIALQAAALVASLLHMFVDIWVGLFGGAQPMRPGEAATLVSIAVLYGWWALLLSSAGRRDALWGLLALAAIWSALANGIAGIAFCPPPCAGASPIGDLSHLGSLGFGVWAATAAWRALGRTPSPRGWGVLAVTVALIVTSFALQGQNVRIP